MDDFLIKKFSQNFILEELENIGFDKSYSKFAQNKYIGNLYKIFGLTSIQATILKQAALSCGCDAATHREVLTHNIDLSDVILFATNSQLKELVKKLYIQPFGLNNLAKNLENNFNFKLPEMNIKNKKFDWEKTYIMGILNITNNSFSDGGEFLDEDDAINHFDKMINNGADIIDIGAESTAPNNKPISVDEEIKRLENILPKLTPKNIPTSIDTRNSATAKMAIDMGIDIINDVSGLCYDENMAKVVADSNSYVILTFDDEIQSNTLDETIKGLIKRVQKAVSSGIKQEKIILDAGLGFNKTFEQNIELIKRADEICSLGFPVLYGVSRKSFVQKITGLNPKETEFANVSLATFLAQKGVNILRVHNVLAHKNAFCAINKVLYD